MNPPCVVCKFCLSRGDFCSGHALRPLASGPTGRIQQARCHGGGKARVVQRSRAEATMAQEQEKTTPPTKGIDPRINDDDAELASDRRPRPTTARGYANRRAATPETGDARGVIFDVDGTLVDSNDAHARAWVEALEESGRRCPSSACAAHRHGRRQAAAGGGRGLVGQRRGRGRGRRRGDIFRERYADLRAFDGARPLVEDLKTAASASASRARRTSVTCGRCSRSPAPRTCSTRGRRRRRGSVQARSRHRRRRRCGKLGCPPS